MLGSFIAARFVSSFITLSIGAGLLLFVRSKTKSQAAAGSATGLWVRALSFGTDAALVEFVTAFIALRSGFSAAGNISILLIFSYFFFFWLFIGATPAMLLARLRVVPAKEGGGLKVWQALARLGMFLFLFIGWVPALFDRKEKKALHDLVARTKVVYTQKPVAPVGATHLLRLGILGISIVLFASLFQFSRGEKITSYIENVRIHFFDFNGDAVPEGLVADVDADGHGDVYKYDLNNDGVVDFTTFDADKDGIAESIDTNNDGRIDGFDFDNDGTLDITVFNGQFFIWLWRVWFVMVGGALSVLLVLAVVKEHKGTRS